MQQVLFDHPTYVSERHRIAWPLENFTASHQERIRLEVAAPRPPERWLKGELSQMQSRSWWEWHWQRGIDPETRREKIDAGLRRQVIERDGYVCGLCGGDVDQTDVHIDHILPFSLGGKNELDNLQVAHSVCNVRKGNRI